MPDLFQEFRVKALVELQSKTLRDIQQETAYVWAARAVAAFELGLQTDAQEYAHEAIEHAALAGGKVYTQVDTLVRHLL